MVSSHVLSGPSNRRPPFADRVGATRPALGLPDNTPTDLTFTQATALVFIENATSKGRAFIRLKGLEWGSIEWPKSDDFVANLTAGIDTSQVTSSGVMTRLLDFWEPRIRPDLLVMIVQRTESNEPPLFLGYPMVSTIRWSGDSQSASFQCLSEPQEKIRTDVRYIIRGRIMPINPGVWDVDDPPVAQVESLPAVFNTGGLGNRALSAESVRMRLGDGSQTHRIYSWTTDGEPNAKKWTTVQALRALAYWWIARFDNPGVSVAEFLRDTESIAEQDNDDPFVRRMTGTVDNLSVQSMDIDAAFVAVAESAGAWVNYEFVVSALALLRQTASGGPLAMLRILVSPRDAEEAANMASRDMGSPTTHDIPRSKPFKDWTGETPFIKASQSKAVGAGLIQDRNTTNSPLFLGGLAEYEVSLLLRPGWTPFDNLDGVDIRDQTKLDDAFDYWIEQFADPEFVDGRIPASIYHAEHPSQIGVRTDTFAGGAGPQTGRVSDVFRLWVFPDSATVVNKASLARPFPHSISFAEKWYDAWLRDDDPGQQVESTTGDLDPIRLMYAHEAYGGGLPLSALRNWAAHRRPLMDTIGRFDRGSTNTGPTVRVHFGNLDENGKYITQFPPAANDPKWTRFAGAVEVLDDRAGIRFLDGNIFNSLPFMERADELFGDSSGGLAMTNYFNGHFWVQVTCTVIADERMSVGLSYQGGKLQRSRSRVIDLGFARYRHRVRRRKVYDVNGDATIPQQAGNSALQYSVGTTPSGQDDVAFEDRDDTPLIQAVADRERAELVHDTIAGSVEVFFLDRTYRPGDVFTGVNGLGIVYDRFPDIERVTWTRDAGGMRTSLTITDTRDNPEAGALP